MAEINRPKKKTYKPNAHTKESIIKKEVYNTSQWRNLRISHLMIHPLCQCCLRQLATEVHHITPISTANDVDDMKKLGFDGGNLMSVCPECHKKFHDKKRPK